MEEKIVISLGGSLIVPENIDIDFIKKFVSTIKEFTDQGFKFYIITGGGKICRNYNKAISQIVTPTNENLDWMGIAATRLNAELIRISFGDLAYERIIMNPDELPDIDKPVVVGGGWKPGNSSDLAAVHMAQSTNAKKIVNLSSVDFVYDSDPAKNPDAKKIENISWEEYIKIAGDEWNPGMNLPFDPVASRKAKELGLELAFIGGHNLESFNEYLEGKTFSGTTIK